MKTEIFLSTLSSWLCPVWVTRVNQKWRQSLKAFSKLAGNRNISGIKTKTTQNQRFQKKREKTRPGCGDLFESVVIWSSSFILTTENWPSACVTSIDLAKMIWILVPFTDQTFKNDRKKKTRKKTMARHTFRMNKDENPIDVETKKRLITHTKMSIVSKRMFWNGFFFRHQKGRLLKTVWVKKKVRGCNEFTRVAKSVARIESHWSQKRYEVTKSGVIATMMKKCSEQSWRAERWKGQRSFHEHLRCKIDHQKTMKCPKGQ